MINEQSLEILSKNIFHNLIEEDNHEKFMQMLTDNITWLGTGKNDFYLKLYDLFYMPDSKQGLICKIIDEWYRVSSLASNLYLLVGKIKTHVQQKAEAAITEIFMHISLIYQVDQSEVKISHLHISIPNRLLPSFQDIALSANKKKCDLAIKNTGIIVFDYDIASKKITFTASERKKQLYPCLAYEDVESIIASGILHQQSANNLRNALNKLTKGREKITTTLIMTDKDGNRKINKLIIANIFNRSGQPIHAVGILKDITVIRLLEQQKQYTAAIIAHNFLTFNADLTDNHIISYSNALTHVINNKITDSFSDINIIIAHSKVFPQDREKYLEVCNRENLLYSYKQNKRKIHLEFRIKNFAGDYIWVSCHITLLPDNITGNIIACFHVADINNDKLRQIHEEEEKQYYKAILSRSAMTFEINYTKDCFIRGNSFWENLAEGVKLPAYSQMLEIFTEKFIIPEDIAAFKKCFLPQNVISAYQEGAQELYHEYRQIDNGNTIWFSCTAHLIRDEYTGEIKGFNYVQNINSQKIKEEALLYNSRHDILTGLYNKNASHYLINEFLHSNEGHIGKHAFFILDMDNFKHINDTYGHVFGDKVIAETGRCIAELFREQDITGRIGGDEFIIFLKNIANEQTALKKAEDLLAKLHIIHIQDELYGNIELPISVSIGIALYKQHGNDYHELYDNSDTALYKAKAAGKGRAIIYSPEMTKNAPDRRGSIL